MSNCRRLFIKPNHTNCSPNRTKSRLQRASAQLFASFGLEAPKNPLPSQDASGSKRLKICHLGGDWNHCLKKTPKTSLCWKLQGTKKKQVPMKFKPTWRPPCAICLQPSCESLWKLWDVWVQVAERYLGTHRCCNSAQVFDAPRRSVAAKEKGVLVNFLDDQKKARYPRLIEVKFNGSLLNPEKTACLQYWSAVSAHLRSSAKKKYTSVSQFN